MENASDAIIMAGAILIFVMALTITMNVFSQVRATIDTVVYTTDETNYYEYIGTEDNNGIKNRRVGLETVIPTLYKYYKENYTVVFLDSNGDPLELYSTKTQPELWTGYKDGKVPPIVSKYYGKNSKENEKICSFDVDEETRRHEPWTGSTIDYKENLDKFLQGETFKAPSGNGMDYNYREYFTAGSFIAQYNGKTFIETIGEYSTNTKDSFASTLNQGIRDNKNKRVIIYQLAN